MYATKYLFFFNDVFARRISLILGISAIFLFPMLLGLFEKHKIRYLAIMFFIIYLTTSVIIRGKIMNYYGNNILVKYQNYLYHNQNLVKLKMKYIN